MACASQPGETSRIYPPWTPKCDSRLGEASKQKEGKLLQAEGPHSWSKTENAEEQSFQTNDFRAPIKQHCGSIGVKQPRPCYFACISCDSAVSSLSPSSLPKRQPSSVGTTPMVSDSVQQEQWKMLHTTPGVTAEWRRHVETAADIDNLDSKSLHTSVGSG